MFKSAVGLGCDWLGLSKPLLRNSHTACQGRCSVHARDRGMWLTLHACTGWALLCLSTYSIRVDKIETRHCARLYNTIQYNSSERDFLLLETCRAKTKHGKRTFTYVGPRLWNALPFRLRMVEELDLFKKALKTYLFTDGDDFNEIVNRK